MERELGYKVNINEQCAAEAKQSNRMLGCINNGISSRDAVSESRILSSDEGLVVMTVFSCLETVDEICWCAFMEEEKDEKLSLLDSITSHGKMKDGFMEEGSKDPVIIKCHSSEISEKKLHSRAGKLMYLEFSSKAAEFM
ncbi:hypothetical protein BTVI_153290 [Pitangus sulphuratus]|nr:hypothetical protein BTVI_153290 [Pitangus sulphuratus]